MRVSALVLTICILSESASSFAAESNPPAGDPYISQLPDEYFYAPASTDFNAPPPEDYNSYSPQPEGPKRVDASQGLGAGGQIQESAGYQAADEIQEERLPPDRAKMLDLARRFVQTIGLDLRRADDELAKGGVDEKRMLGYLDGIPDGETLIFDIMLKKMRDLNFSKLRLPQPVTALKEKRDLLISLTEFAAGATFPIKVHGDEGKADGWFIRQSQPFHLDIKAGQVIAGNKTYKLDPSDTRIKEGDILVRWKTLAQWFGVQIRPNIQGQYMEIRTAQDWPAQEKEDRLHRAHERLRVKAPELPFRKEPYQMAAVPTVDASMSYGFSRTPTGGADHSLGYSLRSTGDLAGFSTQALVTGDINRILHNVTATFSRQSEDNDLLGPLHARYFEFNDIQTVDVPLAGAAPRERGFHATNTNPYITYDTSTQIDGTAPPGWDVEIYRDEQFVQGANADPTGHYMFTNVTLFAGDNRFHIFKYGPRGEVQEELKTLSVAPGAYGKGALYNVSLSQQNTQTYTDRPSHDPDRNTPHFAGSYEKQLTDTLILREGMQLRREGGDQQAYLHTGLVKSIHDVLLNADMTSSVKGPFTSALVARKNFGKHNGFATLSYTTDNYHPGVDSNQSTFGSLTGTTELSGMLPWYTQHQIGYDWKEGFARQNTGLFSTSSGLTLSSHLVHLYVSNDLTYNTGVEVNNATISQMLGTLSVRGSAFGNFWRSTTVYQLMPRPDMQRTSLNITRQLTPAVHSDLQLTRTLQPAPSESVSASLNWRREHETISPTLSYDSSRNLTALVNVSFSLSRNPYTGRTIAYPDALTSFGSVAAFVFLDKDGDGKFSKGDQPLPDATVTAEQDQIRAETDKNGEAFLYNLPVNQVTDIHVTESSSFEPDWVPGFAGVSLRPRPGHVARLVFPVWRGGEMDGTAYISLAGGAKRPLSQTRLYLYDGDGRMKMTAVTAPDGYFVFEKITPGKYWLVAEATDLKDNKALPTMPRPYVFTFAGTTLFGQNQYFEGGKQDLSLSISPDMSDYLTANPGIKMAGLDKNVTVMNLGSYHTRLLASVVWYKLRTFHPSFVAGATPLVKPSEIKNSARTGLHTLRLVVPGLTAEQVYARCRAISAAGFSCGVEIMPKGLPLPHQAEAGDGKDKKKAKG
jgi:hypothetical protein